MTSNSAGSLDLSLQSAIDLYHAGRRPKASALLRRLSKMHPHSAKIWGYLGFLEYETGAMSRAAHAFMKASQISPRSERASMGLFFSLWQQGKKDEALKEMGRFLATGSSKGYRDLLLPTKRRTGNQSKLQSAEIRAVEAAYHAVELDWDDMVTEIDNRSALLRLVNA